MMKPDRLGKACCRARKICSGGSLAGMTMSLRRMLQNAARSCRLRIDLHPMTGECLDRRLRPGNVVAEGDGEHSSWLQRSLRTTISLLLMTALFTAPYPLHAFTLSALQFVVCHICTYRLLCVEICRLLAIFDLQFWLKNPPP